MWPDWQQLLLPLILIVALAILWVVYLIHRRGSNQDETLRLHARFDEYLRLSEQLERRLAELQTQANESSGSLRERLIERFESLKLTVGENLAGGRTQLAESFSSLREDLRAGQAQHQSQFEQRQTETLKILHDTLQSGTEGVQRQVRDALTRHAEDLGKRIQQLTESTEQRLHEISGQVDKRLADGFEKTTQTFADVLKRLAIIDEAQKRITELSTNVVSLQEVLSDKRSRGAFGEVQLNSLVRNVLPESSFALQYALPNNTVADCIVFLPQPTGNIAIDAKFPLEAYRRMTDIDRSQLERKRAEQQFKQDIKKHIRDITEKYIIKGTTSDGAVMFIPAEAVFAEIQAHHPDLVEESMNARVWMVSPTTLWAILNTARAVLKDAATREQVHVIQEHLGYLAKDFDRFQRRMNALATHIKQANDDVQNVNTSAKKITARFGQIERVELESPDQSPPLIEENSDIS